MANKKVVQYQIKKNNLQNQDLQAKEWHSLSLPERIIEKPQLFDIDQLIHIIESLRTNALPFGSSINPQRQAVRVRGYASNTPPAIDVINLILKTPSLPLIIANRSNLAGVLAPLPQPFSEMFIKEINQYGEAGGPGMAFLQIFQERLIGLWHRLNANTYVHLGFSHPSSTPLVQTASAIAGNNQKLPLLTLAPWFWRKSRSIKGALHLIHGYIGLSFSASAWQGKFLEIPKTEASRIGSAKNCQYNGLGVDSVLGTKCWKQAAGFTLISPTLTFEQLLQFLPVPPPANTKHYYLITVLLLRRYFGNRPNITLALNLTNGSFKGTFLGKKSWLGWTTWLGTKNNDLPAAHLRLV